MGVKRFTHSAPCVLREVFPHAASALTFFPHGPCIGDCRRPGRRCLCSSDCSLLLLLHALFRKSEQPLSLSLSLLMQFAAVCRIWFASNPHTPKAFVVGLGPPQQQEEEHHQVGKRRQQFDLPREGFLRQGSRPYPAPMRLRRGQRREKMMLLLSLQQLSVAVSLLFVAVDVCV